MTGNNIMTGCTWYLHVDDKGNQNGVLSVVDSNTTRISIHVDTGNLPHVEIRNTRFHAIAPELHTSKGYGYGTRRIKHTTTTVQDMDHAYLK